jgi:ribosomal protein S18 acetylase RimI-like enzyme
MSASPKKTASLPLPWKTLKPKPRTSAFWALTGDREFMQKEVFSFVRAACKEDYERSAALLTDNDPWLKLGRTYDYSMAKVRDHESELYIARINDKIAACLLLEMHGQLKGFIRAICVDPVFQGRSIGSKMIALAEKRVFKESPNLFIMVSSFNTRAKKLYERLGFLEVGLLKDYVVKGSDEYLLRKTICPSEEFQTEYPYFDRKVSPFQEELDLP